MSDDILTDADLAEIEAHNAGHQRDGGCACQIQTIPRILASLRAAREHLGTLSLARHASVHGAPETWETCLQPSCRVHHRALGRPA